MASCETYWRVVLKAYDSLAHENYLYQPRCKMWKCVSCGRTQKLLWQAKIGNGYDVYEAQGITDWCMLTITSHEKNRTIARGLHVWPDAWKKLSARMRYRYPGVRYVLLPELHEDEAVHWHMIASHGVKTRFLKDNARQCGLGFMADSKPVRESYDAIRYVSKYVSKTIGAVDWPKWMKRIATSQQWPPLPPEEEYDTVDLDWTYLCTYPNEGIHYLADGISKKTGIPTKVLHT